MRLLVHETVIAKILHIFIKLKYDWQGVWNLVPLDLCVFEILQDLKDATQSVLMTDDDHALIVHNLRTNDVVPERHYALDRAFQRFDGWEDFNRHILVADVVGWVPKVI